MAGSSTDNKDAELVRAIEALPAFCKRGQCVEVLVLVGFSEWKIKQAMKELPKHFPLACKYARYRRHEFLTAFKLTEIVPVLRPGAST